MSNKVTAYVINYDKLPDQWDDFKDRFKKVKSLEFCKVNAVANHDIHIQTGLNHWRLVKQARQNGHDMVIVMEDDGEINQDIVRFDPMFGRVITWLRNHKDDWDIFVGSSIGINGKQERIHGSKVHFKSPRHHIISLPCFALMPFIIYNSSSYAMVNEWTRKSKRLDYFLCHPDRKMRIVSTYPFMVYNNDPDLLEKYDIKKEYAVSREFIETRLKKHEKIDNQDSTNQIESKPTKEENKEDKKAKRVSPSSPTPEETNANDVFANPMDKIRKKKVRVVKKKFQSPSSPTPEETNDSTTENSVDIVTNDVFANPMDKIRKNKVRVVKKKFQF